MIAARGLTRTYVDGDGTPVRVLSALDLDVAEGEFVAVVGSSGSGKSTLLHVLGGLDGDFEGEATVAGVKLRGLADKALSAFRNKEVGFVFQSFHLIPNLPARENVMLPSFFGGSTPTAEDQRRADEALGRVGLAGKEARLPTRLSGGERQRVAIARALFNRPRVLLCDEPTGNLDEVSGGEIIDLFRSLHKEGMTLLAVTHEARVSRAAQRVLRLSGGVLQPTALPTTSGEAAP